jgi:hypothetical protein
MYHILTFRPDIVVQVFHARLEALLHNLRNGKYFGGGEIVYIMRVIEYQFRGLPHCHIVFRLQNGPCHSDKQACIRWIEKYIGTTTPTLDEFWTNEDQKYLHLVNTAMHHTCARGILINQ